MTVFLWLGEALGILEPYDVQPYRQMERGPPDHWKGSAMADKVYLSSVAVRLGTTAGILGRWLLAAGGLLYWLSRDSAAPPSAGRNPLILVSLPPSSLACRMR